MTFCITAEAVVQDLQRAPVGLAARVLQLVVELGVLEEVQIQRQRLADDGAVDGVGQLCMQHVLEQRARLRS